MKNVKYRSDDGFMAAEWLAAFAVLVFPMFILSVSILQVPPRLSAVENASSNAARAYVGALNQGEALEQAQLAAGDVISSQVSGYSQGPYEHISIISDTPYCPGSEITIEVSIPIPITINPFGGEALIEFSGVTARSTERIDDHADIVSSDMAAGLCD